MNEPNRAGSQEPIDLSQFAITPPGPKEIPPQAPADDSDSGAAQGQQTAPEPAPASEGGSGPDAATAQDYPPDQDRLAYIAKGLHERVDRIERNLATVAATASARIDRLSSHGETLSARLNRLDSQTKQPITTEYAVAQSLDALVPPAPVPIWFQWSEYVAQKLKLEVVSFKNWGTIALIVFSVLDYLKGNISGPQSAGFTVAISVAWLLARAWVDHAGNGTGAQALLILTRQEIEVLRAIRRLSQPGGANAPSTLGSSAGLTLHARPNRQ